MADNIKVLNEFLPKAEQARLGAIKIGNTLSLDANEVLNVDESAMASAYMSDAILELPMPYLLSIDTTEHSISILAGTKFYYPDGFETDGVTRKFTTITTTTDLTLGPTQTLTTAGEYLLYYNPTENTIGWRSIANSLSGTADPSVGDGITYYNTDTNTLTAYNASGEQTVERMCLPFARVIMEANVGITSIAQEYSGACFVGNALFYLPGIKVLTAGGRERETGKLKQYPTSINRVLVRFNDITANSTLNFATGIDNPSNPVNGGIKVGIYKYDKYWNMYYIPAENNAYKRRAMLGTITTDNTSKITSMKIYQTYVAADKNRIQEQIDTLNTTKLDVSRIQYVSAVPGNPQDGVIYLIAQ